MKLLIIGDIHLKTTEKFGKFNTKTELNTRTEDKLNMLKKVVNYAKENSDIVVFVGDVFDTVNISDRLRQLFLSTIRPLLSNTEVYIILGNHDTNLRDLHNMMSVDALDIDNLIIIKEPKFLMENILLIPFGYSESALNKKADLIISHIEFAPYYKSDIHVDDIKAKIFNGHLHDKNEHHTGSFCVCLRGEINKPHGVIDYDVETGEQHFINVVDRKFTKIDSNVDDLISNYQNYKASDDEIISLKLIDTKNNLDKISVKYINNLFKDAFKVVIDKETLQDEKISIKELQNHNLERSIEEYAKNKELSEFGKEITKKCMN